MPIKIYENGVWVTVSDAEGAGGYSYFTDLLDTPGSYTGEGGKIVAVKSDNSGLEFITAPSAGAGATDKIQEGNTLAEVVDTGSDGHFKVEIEGTERLRVKNNGELLLKRTDTSLEGGHLQFENKNATEVYAIDVYNHTGQGNDSDSVLRFIDQATLTDGTGTQRFVMNRSGAFGIGHVGSENYGTPGQVLTSQGANSQPTWTSVSGGGGSSGIGTVDVKQYADENGTLYGGTNPITVSTNAGIATIGIGTTSNAYGTRYIQATQPTSSQDGDIWINTSSTSASSSDIILQTAQTASGTEVEFTGIPSWAKRITIMFNLVSLSTGPTEFEIQLGTSSAYITSGYTATSQSEGGTNDPNSTTAFIIYNGTAASVHAGKFEIDKFSDTAYTFVGQTRTTTSSGSQAYGVLNGISGTIDRLKITPSTGNFNGGSINISYE